jgi:predicted ATPase
LQSTHLSNYEKIRDVVRLAAPFFDDFQLRPVPSNPEKIQLEWRQRGSDYPLLASQLSDGTLRFICLATALLQPYPPSTMLFDEPELGLHPYALSLLGGMIQKSIAPWGTPQNQIIISTQSALLLNEFTAADIIVVQRANDQSEFRRLDSEQLSGWLADYTLGELWQKNLLGGRPQVDAAHAIPTSGATS